VDNLDSPQSFIKSAKIEESLNCMPYFNYKGFFTREHVRSLINALILLALATVFQFYASAYVNRTPSNSVADLFLNFLPIVNLNFLIVEGAFFCHSFQRHPYPRKATISFIYIKSWRDLYRHARNVHCRNAHRHLSRPDQSRRRIFWPHLYRPRIGSRILLFRTYRPALSYGAHPLG